MATREWCRLVPDDIVALRGLKAAQSALGGGRRPSLDLVAATPCLRAKAKPSQLCPLIQTTSDGRTEFCKEEVVMSEIKRMAKEANRFGEDVQEQTQKMGREYQRAVESGFETASNASS